MKRRDAFTLVELLVAMALILFIMAILSSAFVSATGTFRDLKATGDLAEKLRATTQTLQRDLSADHFEGKKRLSDPNFWFNGPPEQGFFQIIQHSNGTSEGGDLYGIQSYISTDHSLAFTIKMRGNQMSDFPSASSAGGAGMPLLGLSPPTNTLATLPQFGPMESRYQLSSGGSYNYQWAEVAWFLQPSTNPSTGVQDTTVADTQAGTPAMPLWKLYRRQRLLIPDNSQGQIPPQSVPPASLTNFQEISCWLDSTTNTIYFNNPTDITDPQRRFGGIPINPANPHQVFVGNFSPIPAGLGTLTGTDIQLTDVVSFDVRVLVPDIAANLNYIYSNQPIVTPPFIPPYSLDTFVSLFSTYPNGPPPPPPINVFTTPPPTPTAQLPFPTINYLNGNPAFFPNNPNGGPAVFDTWTNINDSLYPLLNTTGGFSQWNVGGQPTSIPLWNGTTVKGPIIQAIQISIRVWDVKTNKTRQVTIIQAM